MPQTQDIFVVNPVLTEISIGRGTNSYLSGEIFPGFSSKTKTGQILRFDPSGEALKPADVKRAPGATARRVDFDIDHPITYVIGGRSLDKLVPDEHKAVLNPAELGAINATKYLANRLRITRELDAVALIDAQLTGDLTSSPSVKWDHANGDAVEDLLAVMTLMEASAIGVTPNSIALDIQVMRAIGESASFKDRVKYTGVHKSNSTPQMLAEILGLDNVYVAKINRQNTAAEGAAVATERIWGERVVVFYKEPPALETMNFGMSMNWAHPVLQGPGFDEGISVEEYREERAKSDGVVMHWYYEDKVINPTAGHLLTNVLT